MVGIPNQPEQKLYSGCHLPNRQNQYLHNNVFRSDRVRSGRRHKTGRRCANFCHLQFRSRPAQVRSRDFWRPGPVQAASRPRVNVCLCVAAVYGMVWWCMVGVWYGKCMKCGGRRVLKLVARREALYQRKLRQAVSHIGSCSRRDLRDVFRSEVCGYMANTGVAL